MRKNFWSWKNAKPGQFWPHAKLIKSEQCFLKETSLSSRQLANLIHLGKISFEESIKREKESERD